MNTSEKKPGIRKRFFAWALRKADFINYRIYEGYKKELFLDLKGTVVEVGPGTGINLAFLNSVDEWIGLEPNEAFHAQLREAAERRGIAAKILVGNAENIPIADGMADAVICTLVLCSVGDPFRAVSEMKRILKQGGKLIFIEHVAAPSKTGLRTFQDILNPLNKLVADGCNCNRETWTAIEQAGFTKLSLSHHSVKEMFRLHRPHIMGYAIK
jgi:ubiquinone/menaquinone biosynthesis C-methylase UbiE